MNKRWWSLLAIVPLLGAVGLVEAAPVAAAAPTSDATAVATAGAEVYVSKNHCTATADGSPDSPYCTISAAAAVAVAGQTVLVQPGDYPEAVSITRSGTESAPITFRAVNSPDGIVHVGNYTSLPTVSGNIFSLSHVHDVVIEGFTAGAAPGHETVLIDGSDRITVDSFAAIRSEGSSEVRVTGGSTAVTISRSYLASITGPTVVIDAGVSNAVVTANQISFGGVLVRDAPGAVVSGNTILSYCSRGIDLVGTSPGASIRNNIVRTNIGRRPCATPENATAVSVSAASTAQTTADYNLIDPITGGALYSWGGTSFWALPAFSQATGHGVHDIAADPLIPAGPPGPERGGYLPNQASPAIDSADATAPGLPPTDMLGNPATDNPAVANTGSGYRDRGAVELQGPVTAGTYSVRRAPGGSSAEAIAAPRHTWAREQNVGRFAYRFSDERFWRVTNTPTAQHSYRRAGSACVDIWANFDGFRSRAGYGLYGSCTIVGSLYTPLAPTRLLDTRAAIGTATTTPVAPNSEIVLPIPSIGQVPAADISAVVLNVTVTQPSSAGFITVFPEDRV
ncbi:right-handed parallel beta-helix repeat-containing protein [Micromonospora sp. NPDC094482]|uniref:right-handed parallel beta-helix repeat-containing protein n=1 Tax=unclassified Micromonospora TaxID=2617518 RepID=UPI00331B9CF4